MTQGPVPVLCVEECRKVASAFVVDTPLDSHVQQMSNCGPRTVSAPVSAWAIRILGI